jgi:hypothetical protein
LLEIIAELLLIGVLMLVVVILPDTGLAMVAASFPMLPVVALVPVLVPLFVVPEFVPVMGFAGVLLRFTPPAEVPVVF